MRKLIYISAILLGSLSLHAQQLPQYSQYMLNSFAMNPAIAGTKPYFQACSDDRYQWVGITDAPRTYMLTLDGPITVKHIGIGTYLFTDITGPTRRIGFTTAYSYHLQITKDINLSLGLSAGILQFVVDGSQIQLDEPGDQALTSQREAVFVPDFAGGIYIYGKNFYLGAACPQIVQSKLKLTTFSAANNELATHYYATAGYNFDINDKFSIDPCMVMKYVNPAPIQFDFGARLVFVKKVWIGGGFRTHDAAYAMVGYTYQDNLTFGYSYDYSLTDIQKYSFGTNEIFIGINFSRRDEKKKAQAQIQ